MFNNIHTRLRYSNLIIITKQTFMAHQTYHPRPCSAILEPTLTPAPNHPGNDSSAVWQCLTWGIEVDPRNMQCAHNRGQRHHLPHSAQLQPNRNLRIKCGCCQDGEYVYPSTEYHVKSNPQNNFVQLQQEPIQSPRTQKNKNNLKRYGSQQKQIKERTNIRVENELKQTSSNYKSKAKQASKVYSPRIQPTEPTYDRMTVEEVKKRRLNDLLKSKQKSLQRIKVEEFVQSQKPFTRGMSDTRFRTYFGKECMEAYGRNNTNQPIGGVIYGNHLKTFNINPHSSSNDPKHYQTHTTALNFAKRTKLDEQKNWKLLEKQFGKQLQLTAVNQTLIPGKDVFYQQVTPQNMYDSMKINHQFAKNNRQEIRQLERDYKRNQVLKQWAKQDQYKAQRAIDKQILKNAPLGSTMGGSQAEDEFRRASEFPQEMLNRQVIYKLVDKNGNVRCGADRHSLTCFVDTNFPENSEAYTTELMKRSPIFPVRVKSEDRHLDEIRKENYVESVVNNYPAHYLIPNVDHSKVVIKSKPDRHRSSSRSPPRQKRPQSYNPYLATKVQTANRNQIQGKPIFQNIKVGANINKNNTRGNLMSPKNQTGYYQNDKGNYFNQSTKMSLGNTNQGVRNKNQEYIANSRYPPTNGNPCQSPSQACSRYACSLKNALLQSSTKNPQFATELMVKASDNIRVEPTKNQRVVNQEYDSRNNYPHANHEMKPKLHKIIKATKIPYAGVESSVLHAIH